ncbi:MAG: phosphoribosylamine--glycine ligase [candidate division NC10 bacterium]|nr:phosphoribosylamine--glycine ligase [candidate division NC10 bacterium]
MKILVVGSGGREHSLVWKLAQSPRVHRLYAAPGNAGIAEQAECVPVPATDVVALATFAEKEKIDLTVVGPEVPLTLGLVDEFQRRGLRAFGASRAAAQIEGSKAFAKALMLKYGIPTAAYREFSEPNAALAYVRERGAPIVVKADGLAAGKGALVCRTLADAVAAVRLIMEQRAFGEAGDRVVVEECREGEEASFLAFTDGKTVLPLASAQDHKPIYDNDEGPNTGGMGAYSPAPVVSAALHRQIMDRVMVPTVRAMAAEGRPYRGVLYAGVMIKDGEAKVLEFNARFGDPEAQPLLLRMDSDLVPVLEAVLDGRLHEVTLQWKEDAAVCVVMASGGYPGTYQKGKAIQGLEEAAKVEGVVIFHAGTARRGAHLLTDGGRVLGVTGRGRDVREAITRTYEAVRRISWEGVHFRTDIGAKALRYPR